MINLNETLLDTKEEVATIFKTKNYNLFGFINGNRNIDPSNLKKIQNSIKKGYVETNAIICAFDDGSSTPLKIIDGQHRYEACKMEGLPISYVIDKTIDMKEVNKALDVIIRMNTASKEWDVNGFMISEAARGNPNYLLYKIIFTKFNFEHELLFFILNSNKERKQNIGFPIFKNGKLGFDEKDFEYMDRRLSDLEQFTEKDETIKNLVIEAGKRYYVKALNILYNTPLFDEGHLLHQLKTYSDLVNKCNTVDQSLEQIRDIYNRHQKTNKIYIAKSSKESSGEIFIK